MAKNILITGGAGFVGSHISDALLAAGHNVRIFDNLTDQVHHAGVPKYLAEEAEFIHGDVREARAVRACSEGRGCGLSYGSCGRRGPVHV